MPYYKNLHTVLDSASTKFFSDVLSNKNYVASSNKVTTLNDLSPNKKNPTNAGAAAGPGILGGTTGINGMPAMQFGTQVYVSSSTGFPANDYTVFGIHQPVAADFTTGNSSIIGDTGALIKGIAYKSSSATLAPYNNSGFVGGSNVLSFANNPEIFAVVVDSINKTATLWQNGVITSGPTTFATFGNDVTFMIGNLANNSGTSYNGLISGIGFCAGALSTSEIRERSNWLSGRYFVNPTFYVFDGDSLTFGQNSTGTFGPYPAQFGQQLTTGAGHNFQILNNGTSGITLATMDLNAALGIDTITWPLFKKQVILTIFGGTNDFTIDNVTPAQMLTRVTTYVKNRAATGKYDRIAVCTLIPRNSAVLTDSLFAYNALLRTAMQTGGSLRTAGATDLIDFNTAAIFNSDTSWNNLTYYNVDATHLTNAGYLQLATTAFGVIGS